MRTKFQPNSSHQFPPKSLEAETSSKKFSAEFPVWETRKMKGLLARFIARFSAGAGPFFPAPRPLLRESRRRAFSCSHSKKAGLGLLGLMWKEGGERGKEEDQGRSPAVSPGFIPLSLQTGNPVSLVWFGEKGGKPCFPSLLPVIASPIKGSFPSPRCQYKPSVSVIIFGLY